jgi:hypothetical protein
MGEYSFAIEEFGRARLGDARRRKRLISIAVGAARHPDGAIARVFRRSCDREGTYRFVENEGIDRAEVISSATRAAFTRARDASFVYVPVDGSTLSLPSVPDDSEMGPVGNKWASNRGVHVMNAIVVAPDGTTLGSAAQVYWTREPRRAPRRTRTASYLKSELGGRVRKPPERPIAEKESSHWGTAMEQAISAAKEVGYLGRLWFQLDAGADFSHLLASATLMNEWVTVRTKNPRRLLDQSGLLAEQVLAAAPVGAVSVDVPGTNNRTARRATLEVRYVPMVLSLRFRGEDRSTIPAPLFAVHAREVSAVPEGERPIDWLLLTNRPGQNEKDAEEVIRGYSMRWRIEEVHRTWKAVANVEDCRLQTVHAVSLWATVLFSVAIRIERQKYFARTHPDEPASVELQPVEIKALCAIRRVRRTTALTIGKAVRWIADLGGYMNPHQGPPGSVTLARGLQYLRAYSDSLHHQPL